jgi:hypothetical protein
MKNIPTFEDFVLNEAKGPDLKDVNRLVKNFEQKAKFVKNMKGMNWKVATEPIIVTNKDLDLKQAATGNYMITGAYEAYGPIFKIEYIALAPNPKFPKTMGVYIKEFDKNVFDKFVDAHKDQFLDPSRLDPKAIKDLAVMVGQFATDELNTIFGVTSQADAGTFKSAIESAFKDVEVSEISNDRLRLDFYSKRAGDGKAVPKTNLLFIVDPTNQTVEFKNPDSRGQFQDAYTDIKSLSRFIKDSIRNWKDADRDRYEASNQEAFRMDR